MNAVQRIAKNMTILLLARVVSMLFGFFYVMYTARYLGPASFGILSFALALTGIFGVITNFGLDPLTVREVARDKSLAGKYLANGIALKLLFGGLTFLIVLLVVNLLGYPEITRKVVYIITLSTIIAGISNLFNDIYQAFERMEFMSIGQVLQSALSLAFALTGISLGLNVVYFAMIYLIVNLIVLGYNVVITAWKFLKPKVEVNLNFWKSVGRESSWFAMAAFTTSIYYYFDSVMVSYMRGDFEVGIYASAYRLANIALIVPQIYFLSVYPKLSETYKKNSKAFRMLSQASITAMWVLGLSLGVLGFVFSNFAIRLVYGDEYLEAIPVFRILIWSIALAYVTVGLGNILDAAEHQKLRFYFVSFSCVLNVIMNYFLIPFYGALGAAISTLIARIVILIAFSILVFKKTNVIPFIKRATIKESLNALRASIFS